MPPYDPPAYSEVSKHRPGVQLPSKEPFTLQLEGQIVRSTEQPSLVFYELDGCIGNRESAAVVHVQKVRYRLSNKHGNGRVRVWLEYLYTFRDSHSNLSVCRNVAIHGQQGGTHCYREVKLQLGLTPRATCKVFDHCRALLSCSTLTYIHGPAIWKDSYGHIVAMEQDQMEINQGNNSGASRLRILKTLSEKELDLLVTCWLARQWKETPEIMRSREKLVRSTFSSHAT